MNAHYFAEAVQEIRRVFSYQYVIRKRIDCARRLLQVSRIRILEVGVRSGFSDHSHFRKVFRRIVGVTPTRYRVELA